MRPTPPALRAPAGQSPRRITIRAASARGRAKGGGCSRMARPILVSYDGTPNDDDALALGRLLAAGGAPLALAYVRHSREFDPRREELAEHDAKRRLAQGAQWLGEESIPQHVVISASTCEG